MDMSSSVVGRLNLVAHISRKCSKRSCEALTCGLILICIRVGTRDGTRTHMEPVTLSTPYKSEGILGQGNYTYVIGIWGLTPVEGWKKYMLSPICHHCSAWMRSRSSVIIRSLLTRQSCVLSSFIKENAPAEARAPLCKIS